jgi:hypothetical protein
VTASGCSRPWRVFLLAKKGQHEEGAMYEMFYFLIRGNAQKKGFLHMSPLGIVETRGLVKRQ